jgi:molybdate transport system ATP-binding protein
MMTTLVAFHHATFARVPGGATCRTDTSLTIRAGEAWAITGPVGSGKTTLAEAIAGRHRLIHGTAEWPIAAGCRAPSDAIAYVGFRESSRAFSYRGKYYQQRYEFVSGDDDHVTLRSFLGRDFDESQVERFHLTACLDRDFVTLSNGQTRKARIVQALASRPRMLVLDDPFVGLDADARTDLANVLGDLHRTGTAIVLVAPPSLIPDWVTHRKDFRGASFQLARLAGHVENLPHRLREADSIVELTEVTVRHGGVTLLDRVSWTVRRGEQWAIVGPNGSGKTTLLSLLCGDQPQAFSQDVKLFGQRRGRGETLWEIKARVGLVSPELHLYFHEPLTARQTIGTGFGETFVGRRLTEDEDAAVAAIADDLALSHLLDRPFAQLSSGEQRLVLIARSLVKRPELLIWDEPFQCLDESAVARVKRFLAGQFTDRQTLLFVTHEPAELPASVTRTFRLAGPAAIRR